MSHSTTGSLRKLQFVDPVAFTPHFSWKKASPAQSQEQVFCERVSLPAVADKFATPTYLYSSAAIDDAYREFQEGLRGIHHTICFAVKSNGNLSILQRLAKLGSGFDIVSGGELRLLQRIGVPGDRIVFSGVGKSREEIREALNYSISGQDGRPGILLFNAESEAELEILAEEAARVVEKGGKPPEAAIRVNPDVLAGGHPHIATGRHEHKFGMDWKEAKRLYLMHGDSKWIRWAGLSAHIGSQITTLEPFRLAGNRPAVSRRRRRLRRSVRGSKAAETKRILETHQRPCPRERCRGSLGAGTCHHCASGCTAYASCLYENEPRQALCDCGRRYERSPAAFPLWRDSSHYKADARYSGAEREAATRGRRWPSVRNRRLFFTRL